jgi:hypothetical protein
MGQGRGTRWHLLTDADRTQMTSRPDGRRRHLGSYRARERDGEIGPAGRRRFRCETLVPDRPVGTIEASPKQS